MRILARGPIWTAMLATTIILAAVLSVSVLMIYLIDIPIDILRTIFLINIILIDGVVCCLYILFCMYLFNKL